MLGFTRRETGVIVFLCGGLILGGIIRVYQHYLAPLPDPVILRAESPDESEGGQQEDGGCERNNQNEPVVLNAANREMLMTLPGIGPVTADRILEYRNIHGPFNEIDSLVLVRGIGPKTLEKMKPYLQLDE